MMGDILNEVLHAVPEIAFDVSIALLPVIAVFFIFQITLLRLPKSRLISMAAGMVYAFIGLILFFLGVEIGFTETGQFLGEEIGSLSYNWILVPIGLLIGFSVVLAEPAVRSLVHQVETVSGGMIHKSAIYASLCIGVALSVALAMIRIVWGLNIWFFLVPGYLAALILAKFSPRMFTAIAFDAGGVATGPMTSTFVMSFALGAAAVIGSGENVAESFGVVALVAMTPLITIQILGLIYQRKTRLAEELLENEEDGIVHQLEEELEEDSEEEMENELAEMDEETDVKGIDEEVNLDA